MNFIFNFISCIALQALATFLLKAKDPQALAVWYMENLGVNFGENSYVTFKKNENNPDLPGSTVFSFLKKTVVILNLRKAASLLTSELRICIECYLN